jgi:hypothetical protein
LNKRNRRRETEIEKDRRKQEHLYNSLEIAERMNNVIKRCWHYFVEEV